MSSNYRSILNAQGSSFASTNSFTFDGNSDYVDLGTNSNLAFSGARSMSVWLKFTDNGGTRYVANFNADKQGIYTSSGKVYFFNRNSSNNFLTIATTNTYNDGQWHNFIGINDGTNLKMYVDGVLNNSNTNGSTGNTSLNIQRIGARWNGSNVFSGLMDELSYYDSDISANANAIGSTTPTDLTPYNPLGWWRMGEEANYAGGEWTLTDQGSGGNDGTSTTLPAPPAQPSTDVPT